MDLTEITEEEREVYSLMLQKMVNGQAGILRVVTHTGEERGAVVVFSPDEDGEPGMCPVAILLKEGAEDFESHFSTDVGANSLAVPKINFESETEKQMISAAIERLTGPTTIEEARGL